MLSNVTAWIVVGLHVVFGLMESVGWDRMARRFGYDTAGVEATRRLALNQGAYNAGLAAVLGWAIVSGNAPAVIAMLIYVVAMALVGAASVRWTIFVIQGLPAVAALAVRLLG